MSNAATDPAAAGTKATDAPVSDASVDKGKNKVAQDDAMDEDEEEEEEEDDEEEEEEGEEDDDEEEEEEDSLAEIDVGAIRSRRTRGIKVDYTSAEAHAKAGLKKEENDVEDDDDEDMKDD
ncbi:hypothetical protein FB45DRAFT_892140 [Roridomyces roridus]|uniref:Histone chaperone domain-containing protein n=1 Tax=Roridomyces roridus TaxID=1738132 RepID=A0AAD7CEQ4_9AGAR|nr:hypothetical protein FB45DRAFT_892140 [Roridomyces roridus]